ncbi:MAG: NnrS family protein [Dehalococcoidia bacterium]|nr:NnrS family protein [Dehalococcoidia bacterium]
MGGGVAQQARPHDDAPYRLFIATSLALAVFGGFLLAVVLPLAQALELSWGTDWLALVQVHGQLQLLGFAGLFVIGMSFRLMPRFSGRTLASPELVRPLLACVALSLVMRAIAQPWASGTARDAVLLGSAALLLAGSLAFASIILRTLAHPASRAEATGWYFCLGAVAYVGQAALNAAIIVEMVRRDGEVAPYAKDQALVFVQLFGFLMLFLSGVATRAIPALTGNARSNAASKVAASMLAAFVAAYAAAAIWAAYRSATVTTARVEDAALLGVAATFVTVVWLAGVFRPRANRVAAASQIQFHFVRAACGWLLVAAALLAWYAGTALADGGIIDSYEADAVRHTLTVGVVTMMIVGMALLVVPEFAGRRLQHPREGGIVILLLVALNGAVVLRVWPALRGIDWVASSRYWPMAAAGVLAILAIAGFALMLVQSNLEQRRPGWASNAARTQRRPHP